MPGLGAARQGGVLGLRDGDRGAERLAGAGLHARSGRSDANYEKLTEFLLANVDWLRPAFGSHNIRSIAHALAVAEKLEVPNRRFEFQMLYGMADPIKEALQSLGQRVRVYTPYGQLLPGMAYLVRRLLENTANESFLRQGFAEGFPEEVLLMNPNDYANGPVARRAGSVSDRSDVSPVADTPGSPFQNEPLTDFTAAENRDEDGRGARSEVRAQFGQHVPARDRQRRAARGQDDR